MSHFSHNVRNCFSGIQTKSDINKPVQSQKRVLSLKFQFKDESEILLFVLLNKWPNFFPFSENMILYHLKECTVQPHYNTIFGVHKSRP